MEKIYDCIVIGSNLTSFISAIRRADDGEDYLLLSPQSKREIFKSEHYKVGKPFFYFNHDYQIASLIERFQLQTEVSGVTLSHFLPSLYAKETLYPFPTSIWELLKTSLISPKGKLHLILRVFLKEEICKDESLFEIVEKFCGKKDAELISEIISASTRGGDPKKTDIFELYPLLKDISGTTQGLIGLFNTVLNKEIGSFHKVRSMVGGEIKLISKIVSEIGVHGKYGEEHISALKCGDLYRVQYGDRAYVARNLIMGLDSHEASRVLKSIDIELADLLKSINYSRSIDVNAVLGKGDIVKLSSSSVLLPEREKNRVCKIDFIGETRDTVSLRFQLDGTDGNLWSRSDSDLIKLVHAEGRSVIGMTKRPDNFEVIRHERSIPQFHIGHHEIVQLINNKIQGHKGLILLGDYLDGIHLESVLEKKTKIISKNDTPNIVRLDPYLEPQKDAIIKRKNRADLKHAELVKNSNSLRDFASGYQFFGMHQDGEKLVIREWAPNAESIYLVCGKNQWKKNDEYRFARKENDIWEICLDSAHLKHLDQYKLLISWNGGEGERIPSYANYVVQDPKTHLFSACVWSPKQEFKFKNKNPKRKVAPIIYECHVGMSSEEGKVNSYNDFTDNVLPRIVKAGYNTVQIMAIQEHPYYGSFGYQVSNFFAPSSRSGTPDDLKRLIDTAHGLGVRVIMDIVHSHAVKNENEGLGRFDGTQFQYFHDGEKGLHPAWDTYCFNYGKNEVIHFLLSNVRYWMEEFRFDGFRYDGVTSMLYQHHGLGKAFTCYDDYFGDDADEEAITYLTLANRLMKEINPQSISIAEDMSGLPGIAAPIQDGGVGFDFRLAMGIPDFWIKVIKEKSDEEWSVREIWNTLMDVRYHEGSISYLESHDQALVGDKTTIFRLIDKDMYTNMSVSNRNHIVDRGISVQKLIRFITFITSKDGYLNFMGNEFGHPEWIDFPREGNDWSYHYARRQWSLSDNPELCYKFLADFDQSMIELAKNYHLLESDCANEFWLHDGDKVIAVRRGGLFFVFNFDPNRSYREYMIPFPEGKYSLVFHSDLKEFGGFENLPPIGHQVSTFDSKLSLYIPARTVQVYKMD